MLILDRHFLHLNGKARQHPRAPDGHQVPHPETAGSGMEISRIQHLVAEMPQEHPSRKIAVERLCNKLVCSYFVHYSVFMHAWTASLCHIPHQSKIRRSQRLPAMARSESWGSSTNCIFLTHPHPWIYYSINDVHHKIDDDEH